MDHDAITRGTVPWSADEYLEVMQWYDDLHAKPKDDWDLTEKTLRISHGRGREPIEIAFNAFHPMNQFGGYMVKRYGEKMPNHMERIRQIEKFLEEHQNELRRAGHTRQGDDGKDEIRTPVLQALCELPYSQRRKAGRKVRYRFDFAEVMQRAGQIEKEG